MISLISFLTVMAVVPQAYADFVATASLAARASTSSPIIASTLDTRILPAGKRILQAVAVTSVNKSLAPPSSTQSSLSSTTIISSTIKSDSMPNQSSSNSSPFLKDSSSKKSSSRMSSPSSPKKRSSSISSTSSKIPPFSSSSSSRSSSSFTNSSSFSASSSLSTTSSSSSSSLSSTTSSNSTSSSSSSSRSTTSPRPTGPITTLVITTTKTTFTVSHGKTHDSDSAGGFFIFGGSGGGVLAFPGLFNDITFVILEGALDDVETGENGKPTTTSEATTEPKTSTSTSSSSQCSLATGYDYWVECYSTTSSGQSLSCVTISTSKTIGCSPTTTIATTTLAPACSRPDPADVNDQGEEGGCIDDLDCNVAYCLGTVAPPTHGTGPGAYINSTCQQYLTGCSCTATYLTPGFCSGYVTFCSLPNCNGQEVNGQWACTGQFAGCNCTHITTTTTTYSSNTSTSYSSTTSTSYSSTTSTSYLSTTSTSYAYATATTGIGCADITYYNFIDASYVSTSQCLDFCSSDTKCQAAMLQCSQKEPCTCWVNDHPFTPSDLQCGVPSQYYGQFTYYNKGAPL